MYSRFGKYLARYFASQNLGAPIFCAVPYRQVGDSNLSFAA